jgi:hypothetical protein
MKTLQAIEIAVDIACYPRLKGMEDLRGRNTCPYELTQYIALASGAEWPQELPLPTTNKGGARAV